MAKPWKEVMSSTQYQSLPPDQQAAAQEQYFNEVVAPQAGDQADAARQQFFSAYPTAATQQQQPNTMWQEQPRPTQESAAWGDQQPQTQGQQLAAGAVDVGKGLLQAGVNVANIPAEMADAVASAGSWAANKLGLGDGKYSPAPRIELPANMQPQTTGGKLTGEVLPYLIPTGLASAPTRGAGIAERIGTKAAQMTAENVPGALAQSSGAGQQDDLAGNLAQGVVGSAAGRAVAAGASKVAGPVIKSAREWLSPTQKVISEADDAARLTATGEDVQNEVAKTVGSSAQKQDYEALAGEIKPQESILKAAKALDMEDALLPSHYSGSQTYRAVEQGLKSVPASQLRAKEYETINQLAQKADDMIGIAGGTQNKVALSEKFKSESQAAIDELAKKSDSIYDQIGSAIPKSTPTRGDSTIAMLRAKAKELGGEQHLSGPEKMVLNKFDQGKGVGKSLPTYGLVDNTRKQIGAAINKNEGPFKDQTTAELKRLYASITDDQEKVAQQFGMGEKWGVAKNLVSQRKSLEDHMVNALGKDLSGTFTNKMTPAIQNLRKGNVQAFDKLMASTPPHMRQEVVASALNDVFTLGSRKEKQLSIPGFVDWYEGAKRSGALNRVMKYLPTESRRNISNLYKVSSGIRRANEEAINNGRLGTLIDSLDSKNGVLEHLHGITSKAGTVVGGAIGTAAAGPMGGVVGAGIGGALSHAANKAASRPARSVAADALLADPRFQNALIKATEKNKATVSQVIQGLPSWKRFAGHLSGEEAKQAARVGSIAWLNGEAD